ncbi:MAG: TonB-dependent receptor, partial [Vicinamibacteria bacterium]
MITDIPTCLLTVEVGSTDGVGANCVDHGRRVSEGETILFRAAGLSLGEGPAACRLAVERVEVHLVARQDQAGLARDLPSSRNVWSHLETVEAAAILDRIDGAGLYLGTPGRFSMRGASWTQNTILLDGVDVTDPGRGGVPLFDPDLGALESIDVTSALAPVELSAPGVTLALVPRAPSRSWQGTAQVDALSSGLQAEDAVGGEPSIARFGALADGSGTVTGPISDRVRVLLSGRIARVRRFERNDPAELESRIFSLFGHLVHQPSDRHTLRLLASVQARRRPFAGRARFFGDPVTEQADSVGGQVAWTHVAESATWSASAGLWSGLFVPQTDGREPGRPIERLLDGPVPELVFPARSRRSSWTVATRLALRGSRLGGLWHTPRFGLALKGASATEQPGVEGPIPELVDGLSARAWEYAWAGPDSRRQALDFVAYAADRLVLRDRLLVEGGLRLDATRGEADGAAGRISWVTVSPRVSARLRLGRISLIGGWGEYRHRLLLDHLAYGDPRGPHALVYRWSDSNEDGRFDAMERGPLVARVGPGAADEELVSIDPGLRPPRTREFVAGVEARLGGGWTVGLTGFDRRERDLIESVNVGVPPSGYTVHFLPDPAGDIDGPQDDQLLPVYDRKPETFGLDRYLLTNPPGHTTLHQTVELRAEKAFGKRFFLLAGATASRTEMAGASRGFRVQENDQGLVGELFDNPNADTHARGRSFFDRAFTIKIAATWRAPGDWRAGVVARYQDGQPFSRVVVVPDLAQGP